MLFFGSDGDTWASTWSSMGSVLLTMGTATATLFLTMRDDDDDDDDDDDEGEILLHSSRALDT